MVHGTPTACDRNPDSRPPKGIIPPNTSAQMPITRPRIALDTLRWIRVLVVEKYSSIPQPPTARQTSASGYQRTSASATSMAENNHSPPRIRSRGRTRLPQVATVSAPKSAPQPLALSRTP